VADSANHTLRLLREFRQEFKQFRKEFGDFRGTTDDHFAELARLFADEMRLAQLERTR
jgi:hypothetical protein